MLTRRMRNSNGAMFVVLYINESQSGKIGLNACVIPDKPVLSIQVILKSLVTERNHIPMFFTIS